MLDFIKFNSFSFLVPVYMIFFVVENYLVVGLEEVEYALEGLVLNFPGEASPQLHSRRMLIQIDQRLLNH